MLSRKLTARELDEHLRAFVMILESDPEGVVNCINKKLINHQYDLTLKRVDLVARYDKARNPQEASHIDFLPFPPDM